MSEYAGPRQLRHLLDAIMSVGSGLNLATVLERVVLAAQELVGARYAALGVLDPTRTYLTEFITVGLNDAQRAAIGGLPKGHGILGLLIADPRPIRLPDLSDHPARFGFPPDHPPMTSFLGVPLYVRGEAFGNLYLTDKLGADGFSDIDEELAVGLAAAAALAIENAALHQHAEQLALMGDRERIARDLHDSVVQRLFATGLAMQATATRAHQPEIVERLQAHVDELDATIREVRSAIFAMESARLPNRSLRRDILDLVADSARVLGFDPVVRFDGPVDFSITDDTAMHLLAVLREALSNIARHANATHVEIAVQADNDLALHVLDNGNGCGPNPSGGNGVRNMTRRAQDLGGHATISPAPTGGTRLEWVVPLQTKP